MILLRLTVIAVGIGVATSAYAGCALSSGPCSTDNFGNTYRTEQNLGGGYTTRRNGSTYSTTDQNLGGGYTERYTGGGSRTYDYDPYGSGSRGSYGARRNGF